MEVGQGFFVVEPDGLGDKAFDNADVFIEFLKRPIKNAGREIFLIIDAARLIGRRKPAISCNCWGGKSRLFFLPSHAPDGNPDA